MDKQLEGKEYFVSDELTIVDMAAWGWVGSHVAILGEGGIKHVPNLSAWWDRIESRPAAERVRNIGKDIAKPEFNEETARALFPSNFSNL